MAYSAKIVELDGTVVRTLVNCNIKSVVDELNAPGTFMITIPKYETGSAIGQYNDIRLGREIQILRGATVIARGPALKPAAASGRGDVTLDGNGVGWYFTRRYIDAPITNLLTNPSFESGLTGWTAVGCTASVVTSPFRRGANAVQLVGTSTGAEQYLTQTITGITATSVGLLLTLAGWSYINSWTGPALEARGLYIELLSAGVVQTHNSYDGVIDDASARSAWERREITTWIPPSLTWDARVRLYAPNGTITYDALSLTEMESLAVAPGADQDIATMANLIVAFVQDTTHGKTDLHINTTTPPTTGKNFVYPKAWQYADHTPADRALNDEIVPLGVDWAVDPATKTFTVYSPMKGTDRSATITLALGTNLADYEYNSDGTATATGVTMLGDGDGPSREEGLAVDTASVSAMLLETVESAPPGTTLDKLDALATDKLDRTKRAVHYLKVTTVNKVTDLVATLAVGDTVSVSISDGVIQIAGFWRIIRRELIPRSEILILDLVDIAATWDSATATWDSATFTWTGFTG